MCFYPQSPLDRIPTFFGGGGVCFLKVVFSPDIYLYFFYNKKIHFMHISLSVGVEKNNI